MNTCENCVYKEERYYEHPCSDCIGYDNWIAPVDGMRELSMRLLDYVAPNMTVRAVAQGGVYLSTNEVERLVRAAICEGMRHAASHIDHPIGDYGHAFAAAIRAEAEKIKG